jgi:hypothetical protein
MPIFSQAKLECFADILLPLAYHQENSNSDLPLISWAEKKDVLFWRGSTTVMHDIFICIGNENVKAS